MDLDAVFQGNWILVFSKKLDIGLSGHWICFSKNLDIIRVLFSGSNLFINLAICSSLTTQRKQEREP
jgi:hypothetical protein